MERKNPPNHGKCLLQCALSACLAVLTAALFTVGKYLIGLYLGSTAVASAYGAAGSFVVLLFWIYYSSLILLFGAEFTQAHAAARAAKA